MPAQTLTAGQAGLVVPIEAFTDNYIWAVVHDGCAVVVDPGQAPPVQAFLDRHGLRLRAILLTHHHADHVAAFCNCSPKVRSPSTARRVNHYPIVISACRKGIWWTSRS